MVDNTTLNLTSGGDSIRDIGRTNLGVTVKTQVMALDTGGSYGEALVDQFNGLNVANAVLSNALTSGGALATFIAGDPSGDWAGVNLLEVLMDETLGLGLGVRIVNQSNTTQPISHAAQDLAQNSTTAGQVGTLVQGAVVATPAASTPTNTVGKTSPLTLNAFGALRIAPGMPDGNITGSPPESMLIGGWGGIAGNTIALRMNPADIGSIVVRQANPYPVNVAQQTAAVPLEVSGTAAAAANNQTLAGAANKTTYITGFDLTGCGATAGSTILVTVTGLTNTLNYYLTIPAGATVATTPLSVRFNPPLPASATNTAIVVNVPSYGAGNTLSAASAYGYQL